MCLVFTTYITLFQCDVFSKHHNDLLVFKGQRRPAQINPRGDGTFDVVYYPDVEGPCKVDVLYAGKPALNRSVR